MPSSGERFWKIAGSWATAKQKPHIGVEFRSPSEYFAFKAVVTSVIEGEGITLRNLETGEERLLDLRSADFRIELSDPPSRIRDLSFASFACIVRIMWEDDDGRRCTLIELRDTPVA